MTGGASDGARPGDDDMDRQRAEEARVTADEGRGQDVEHERRRQGVPENRPGLKPLPGPSPDDRADRDGSASSR